MVSLQDSWQAGRKQRQQEVVDRRQHVRNTLDCFQQERQVKTAEMREALRLFQIGLQLETQDFLTNASVQRQAQATHLIQHLQAFVQTLREQTAEVISLNAAERSMLAQQLAQDLSEFHGNLSTSVALLRQTLHQQMQDIRQEVQTLQAETQTLLEAHQQERIRNQIQLMQVLDEWTNTLRSSVQMYLAELGLVRQDRAQQVQSMLQQERNRRKDEVNDLFQEFAQFREELVQYCTDLKKTVWGNDPAQPTTQLKTHLKTQLLTVKPTKSIPRGFAQPIEKQPVSAAPRKLAVNTTKNAARPVAVRALKRQKTPPIPSSFSPTSKSTVSTPAPQVERNENQIEKDIYTHIHRSQGARLTELEAALGINRFQAVDALRSLIKKGFVTQRDRMYLIQEDINP